MLAENTAGGLAREIGPQRPGGTLEFNDAGTEPQVPRQDGGPVVVDDEAITCRYIRGLQNPVWGGPDLAAAGDSIVALYVDTNPVLADLIADQVT